MISLEEVNRTILELESKDTSYAVCEKLAWLYIVRDNIQPTSKSQQSMTIANDGGSEFVQIALNVPADKLIYALDEHMQTIRLVYPKEYDLIIEKIRSI